jgi:hypothetical protein
MSVESSQVSRCQPNQSEDAMPSLLYFSTVKEQKRVRDARKGQTAIIPIKNISSLTLFLG